MIKITIRPDGGGSRHCKPIPWQGGMCFTWYGTVMDTLADSHPSRTEKGGVTVRLLSKVRWLSMTSTCHLTVLFLDL